MSEKKNRMVPSKQPKGSKLVLFLLIGCLSMFFAEVFAGSSQIWIIDPWSLLVTFPLYLGHLLFYFNVAIKTKRTSIPQLYLFGVLFGLYESWITKVLWAGYPGSPAPLMGLVAGIAILEFFTLVLFWHPLLAFILPILVFELMSLSTNSITSNVDNENIFPSHARTLQENSKFKYVLFILVFIGSSFLSFNAGFNIIIIYLSILSSLSVVFLLYQIARKRSPGNFSIQSLQLGEKGFVIVIIYLGLLYLFIGLLLSPENIPISIFPYVTIIGFYLFIVIILKFSKPIDENVSNLPETTNKFLSPNSVFLIIGVFFILTMVFCLIPLLTQFLFIFFTLSFLIIGSFLLIYFLVKALRE